MTTDDTPTFMETVAATGINPGPIYAKCKILMAFHYPTSVPAPSFSTPVPGRKPIRKKRK